MAVVIRRGVITRCIGVARRVAVVIAHARRMVIGTIGAVRTIAVATVVAVVITGRGIFLIDAGRSPGAGTGIGRALVDVVILLLGIGEPGTAITFITIADAAAGIAARRGIGRNRHRVAARVVTARHRRRSGHDGDCRD